MKYPIYVINYCNPNLYLAACVGHHLIILIIRFPHFPQPTFFFGCSQCFKLKQTRSMRGRKVFSNFLLLVLGLLLILPSWSCNYLVNSVEIYRRNSFKPIISTFIRSICDWNNQHWGQSSKGKEDWCQWGHPLLTERFCRRGQQDHWWRRGECYLWWYWKKNLWKRYDVDQISKRTFITFGSSLIIIWPVSS